MSFGQILRTAREAKGLTTSELAAQTHLLVQIVEGLENEDFRRIPAPIYGRGFVKLYCETVGLDPKPMQAEFMALYAQGKSTSASTISPEPPPTAKTPEPPPVAEPEPQPVVEAVPPPVAEPEPQPVAEAVPPPAAEPDSQPPPESPTITNEVSPRRSYGDLFEQAYAQPESPKPSATEKFRDTMSNVSHGVFANVKKLPPNTGRIITVIGTAILLLVLIGWGISVLYKATSPHPAPEKPATTKPASPKPESTTAKPQTVKAADIQPGALKASGIQIPSLYID